MLKLVELEMPIKENGVIELPIKAMKQMKLHTQDVIRLIYMAEGEDNLVNATREFLLTREGQDIVSEVKQRQSVSFEIPMELLADAEISANADLDIVCSKGKITILSAEEEKKAVIPSELMAIFEELGISEEKARVVLQTEREVSDGKTESDL